MASCCSTKMLTCIRLTYPEMSSLGNTNDHMHFSGLTFKSMYMKSFGSGPVKEPKRLMHLPGNLGSITGVYNVERMDSFILSSDCHI